MKLYIIVALLINDRDKIAIDQFLRPFRSKLQLGENCWLVCSGGTASLLRHEIEERVGRSHPIIVSRWNGDSTWTNGSMLLANWLPKRLASLTN